MNHKEDRVVAIDVLKGMAISVVILIHFAARVLTDQWNWLYNMIYLFGDVFGPALFAFLSSISVTIAIHKKRKVYCEKDIRNSILKRSITLIFLSFIVNLVMGFDHFGFLAFWRWQIIQFIGFSQIITYYILKLQGHQRVILAFITAYITPIIFNYITSLMFSAGIDYHSLRIEDLGNPVALLYYFLFQHYWAVPILPWIYIIMVGSVVGENLISVMSVKESGDKKLYYRFFRNVIIDGSLIIIAGILTGMKLLSEDFGLNIWEGIQSGVDLFPNGIPEFLVHSSVPNIMYSLGLALIFTAIIFYLCEIKKIRGKIIQFLAFFGRYSLTIFVLHPVFWIGIKNLLGPLGLFSVTFLVIAILGLLLYIWNYKLKGIGTIEWFLNLVGNFKMKKRALEYVTQIDTKEKEIQKN